MSGDERALEHLRQLINVDDFPVGLYATRLDGSVAYANAEARRILGLGPDEGANFADFRADPAAQISLPGQVAQAESKGDYWRDMVLDLRVGGNEVHIRHHCRSLRDPQSSKTIGYLGALIDITEEERSASRSRDLNRRITDLTTDIGRVLHANTSALLMVDESLKIALQALGPNPFPRGDLPVTEEIDAALEKPALDTADALEKLVELLADESRQDALPPNLREELNTHLPTLREFREIIPVAEVRTSALRYVSRRVQDIAVSIAPGTLPRELTRKLAKSASTLERLTALISLLRTRIAVLQMQYTIRSLRDFITSDLRHEEPLATLAVTDLLRHAREQLADYATSSGVNVTPEYDLEGVCVRGSERDLIRAFANILHNSIKYSWHRDRSAAPWVTIRGKCSGGRVNISFENWGVPIAAEEIERELIFELGYRGKWSTDRGRLGTGIGLTDAREVAAKHGGELTIDSRPARSWDAPTPDSDDYYTQPFITTVTISFPASKRNPEV